MLESPRVPDVIEATDSLALLSRDFQARIVNYSPNGCLLHTSSPLEVGTVGRLRFMIDGSEFADDVQVVRCQPIEGAGSLYQVGAKFLWTVGHGAGSLRRALSRLVSKWPIRLVE